MEFLETVYINDKPIILTDNMVSNPEYEVCVYKDLRMPEILHKLRYTNLEGVFLYHNDLDELRATFVRYFVYVEAAGGFVKDEKERWLFIRRNNHWDLPKGHMEQGESSEQTAIREVEEECGVSNLEILGFIKSTYHIYKENKSEKLKKTYWYAMCINGHPKPKPQLEEGITDVVFKPKHEIKKLYSDMYGNIRQLVDDVVMW